jgi:hypothetical protein
MVVLLVADGKWESDAMLTMLEAAGRFKRFAKVVPIENFLPAFNGLPRT